MKRFTIILMLALLVGTAWARNTSDVYHEVQVVDEVGAKVTTISSVSIYAPGTTTNAVIYKDRNRQNTITVPLTSGSDNTTLSNGRFSWYGPGDWAFSITDGTNIATNANHRDRSASEGTLVFPTYLTSISTTTYTDAQSATFGSTDSAQLQYIAGTAFRLTPSSDGVIFQVGVPSGNQFDTVFLVGGGTDGLTINEGASTLVWTGGTASLNNSGSGATNIGVGSSGAISIGDGSSGVWSIDGTAAGTISADDSIGMTTSGAGANITIDAVLGSVLIDSGENAALAISLITNTGSSETIKVTNTQGTSVTEGAAAIELLAIAGGVELRSTANLANAVALTADSGTTTSILIFNDTGISATDGSASIQITSDLGGIELLSSLAAANQIRLNAAGTVAGFAVVLETTDGGIQLNADGGTNGDITLDAASVITLIAADAAGIVTNVGTFEHKGIFYNFSAGIVSASEMIVEPGQGLLCVGLTSGAAEIGSTEGFVGSDTETDFIRFMITMPDDWVDTGTQADVILTFDIDEQASEECNIDFRMFEYDGAANTTPIITDTIVAADNNTRAFKPLVSNSAGIGNETDLKPGSVYIIELTGNAAADDFNIYGMKMVYRVGLQPSE